MSRTGKRVGAVQIKEILRHVSQPLRKSRPTTKYLPTPYTVFVLLGVQIRLLSSLSNIDSQFGGIFILHYSFESFAFDAFAINRMVNLRLQGDKVRTYFGRKLEPGT